ncbi:NADPH dehydrogenase NamA [Wukongibacter baidiensis]|uniref:NADPH dehydrogenase NamA n=1 Tax=Wukongibacter baidiensis TaxID=1723361 RepID=UPI003D7F39FC
MSKLFSNIQIKDMELKNRIVMAPMCMDSAESDGKANEWHYIHYVTRAVGGVGLILLESTAVESRGRITNKDLGIWSDNHIEGLKRIVKECKKHGSKIGIQLGHAGRKCEVSSEEIIGPSPIAFNEEYMTPREMSKDDINDVISSFVEGAIRADKAGFDAIELHGAHGYLIGQFLSPLTNRRDDEYGGSLPNRAKFLKKLISEVRKVWPNEKPIFLRISAEEYHEDGNHPEDLAMILNLVKAQGIDVIDVSSGGVVPAKIETYPGYQIKMAEIIRETVCLPVIGGGLITNSEMAEEIITSDRSDLVYLGRELLRNPYWPLQASRKSQSDVKWPIQYERSKVVRKNGF